MAMDCDNLSFVENIDVCRTAALSRAIQVQGFLTH